MTMTSACIARQQMCIVNISVLLCFVLCQRKIWFHFLYMGKIDNNILKYGKYFVSISAMLFWLFRVSTVIKVIYFTWLRFSAIENWRLQFSTQSTYKTKIYIHFKLYIHAKSMVQNFVNGGNILLSYNYWSQDTCKHCCRV